MIALLFKLLCGHAIADYALQSDFMARNKNRNMIPVGYDPALHGPMQKIWPYVLTSHALIHGSFVFMATGRYELGIAETVSHCVIDFGKCEKWYGIHTDQIAHILCKVLWMYLAIK